MIVITGLQIGVTGSVLAAHQNQRRTAPMVKRNQLQFLVCRYVRG